MTPEQLTDGTILTSVAGHRVKIDGRAGGYLKIVDAGGRIPLPPPGWMAIGAVTLAGQINNGNWEVVQ